MKNLRADGSLVINMRLLQEEKGDPSTDDTRELMTLRTSWGSFRLVMIRRLTAVTMFAWVTLRRIKCERIY